MCAIRLACSPTAHTAHQKYESKSPQPIFKCTTFFVFFFFFCLLFEFYLTEKSAQTLRKSTQTTNIHTDQNKTKWRPLLSTKQQQKKNWNDKIVIKFICGLDEIEKSGQNNNTATSEAIIKCMSAMPKPNGATNNIYYICSTTAIIWHGKKESQSVCVPAVGLWLRIGNETATVRWSRVTNF